MKPTQEALQEMQARYQKLAQQREQQLAQVNQTESTMLRLDGAIQLMAQLLEPETGSQAQTPQATEEERVG